MCKSDAAGQQHMRKGLEGQKFMKGHLAKAQFSSADGPRPKTVARKRCDLFLDALLVH